MFNLFLSRSLKQQSACDRGARPFLENWNQFLFGATAFWSGSIVEKFELSAHWYVSAHNTDINFWRRLAYLIKIIYSLILTARGWLWWWWWWWWFVRGQRALPTLLFVKNMSMLKKHKFVAFFIAFFWKESPYYDWIEWSTISMTYSIKFRLNWKHICNKGVHQLNLSMDDQKNTRFAQRNFTKFNHLKNELQMTSSTSHVRLFKKMCDFFFYF